MRHDATRPPVRSATVGDAPAIAAVQVRSWRAGYRGILPEAVLAALSVLEREARWRTILDGDGDGGFTLVAAGRRERVVAGFCSIVLPSRDPDADERTGEVAALYVDPSRWRHGVGRTLLDEALARVPAGRWQRMTLWVLAGNERARRFYAAAGFHPDGATAAHAASGATEVRLRTSLPRR